MVQEIEPNPDRKNVSETFNKTTRKKHGHLLTKGVAKAQATATKRTAIAPRKQCRWRMLPDRCFDLL